MTCILFCLFHSYQKTWNIVRESCEPLLWYFYGAFASFSKLKKKHFFKNYPFFVFWKKVSHLGFGVTWVTK